MTLLFAYDVAMNVEWGSFGGHDVLRDSRPALGVTTSTRSTQGTKRVSELAISFFARPKRTIFGGQRAPRPNICFWIAGD